MEKIEKNSSKTTYLIKVGTDDRPATESDIEDVAKAVSCAKDQDVRNIITHHAIEIIELDGNATFVVSGHKVNG